MSRIPSLNSPFLLGFDAIERALDRVTRTSADGYPPYNIERLVAGSDGPERLRITLAVAGFTRDQLEITLEESQIVIKGRQQDEAERNFCIVASPRGNSSVRFFWQKACGCSAPI